MNLSDDHAKMMLRIEATQAIKASDEYQVACRAAIQANKLEFSLKDDKSGATFDSGKDGDDSSTFDHCTVSVTVCPDGDMPRDEIASLRMTAIAKSRVNPATFYDDIFGSVLDDEEVADSLLSRHGTFRFDRWGCGARYEGTGVWHSEFGKDLLVYIEDIDVKYSFRGMGIDTKLFNQALDWVGKKAHELGQEDRFDSYLVVAPGFHRMDLVREFGNGNLNTGGYGKRQAEVNAFGQKLADKAVAFWRSQGFRRVGLSRFWAYATNPDHPSRQLTAEEDAKRDNIDPPF